jgi:hypothetical protein
MAEWLSRQPRKLFPSGAQVRILLWSIYFFDVAVLVEISTEVHVGEVGSRLSALGFAFWKDGRIGSAGVSEKNRRSGG